MKRKTRKAKSVKVGWVTNSPNIRPPLTVVDIDRKGHIFEGKRLMMYRLRFHFNDGSTLSVDDESNIKLTPNYSE